MDIGKDAGTPAQENVGMYRAVVRARCFMCRAQGITLVVFECRCNNAAVALIPYCRK